jgi:DNA-directed RNA polymerase subunit K/omega
MNKFEVMDHNEIVINHDQPKRSRNILTKYEKTTIIGVRIEQLAYGSPTTLCDDDKKLCTNIRDIAELELKRLVIPFMVCRHLPNKTDEYWKIKDFIIL